MSTISKILKEHSRKSGKPKHQSLKEEHGPRKRKMVATGLENNVSDASILKDIEEIAPRLYALAKKYGTHGRANLYFTDAYTQLLMLRDEIKSKKLFGTKNKETDE